MPSVGVYQLRFPRAVYECPFLHSLALSYRFFFPFIFILFRGVEVVFTNLIGKGWQLFNVESTPMRLTQKLPLLHKNNEKCLVLFTFYQMERNANRLRN